MTCVPVHLSIGVAVPGFALHGQYCAVWLACTMARSHHWYPSSGLLLTFSDVIGLSLPHNASATAIWLCL